MGQRDKHGQFAKGSSGFTGKHSEESKRKMSQSHKETAWNKGRTKENDEKVRKYAAKVSATLMGHSVSAESRQKMRAAKLGVKRSPKICKTAKDRIIEPHKPAHKNKIKLSGIRFGKGCRHSEESRKKMSASHKREFAGGRMPWNEGLTKEIDERLVKCGAKISIALAGRTGPLSTAWRGGKSFEPYPIGWTRTFKEQIRRRDNYTCQLCGVPEAECHSRLHVHHIDYDKKNIAIENLISLCKKCHGRTSGNRDYWKEYFQCLIAG